MREQAFEHFEVAAACGIEPRRAAVDVARLHVGAGGEQGFDDLDVAATRGFVQRAAAGIAASAFALCLSSKCTPATSSSSVPAAASNAGAAFEPFGFRAAFEQEAREAPVARGAGDAERGPMPS